MKIGDRVLIEDSYTNSTITAINGDIITVLEDPISWADAGEQSIHKADELIPLKMYKVRASMVTVYEDFVEAINEREAEGIVECHDFDFENEVEYKDFEIEDIIEEKA